MAELADQATDGPPLEAFGAALATLPGMGPARLGALARTWPLDEAWRRVATGRADSEPAVAQALATAASTLPAAWVAAAAGTDPAAVLAAHEAAGVGVSVLGAPGYPGALADDLEPPVVLFHQGRLDALDGPRVAIVGTRACTPYGREVARDLGRDLAEAGVRVVSGLALGIDGAAHTGALRAGGSPVVGVVGSGHDVVYPRGHRELWRRVATEGLLLSESPLGSAPDRWRFPSRNRLLAALADAVVVVESRRSGGSMYTVDAALEREVAVLAVPGPVGSPASEGTNLLLGEGALLCQGADDVLTLLGLSAGVARRGTGRVDPRPAPTGVDHEVLEALGHRPAALEQLAARTGLGLADLATALHRLEATGWVTADGGWYARAGRPDR